MHRVPSAAEAGRLTLFTQTTLILPGMGIHEWKTPSELEAVTDAAARAASRIEWDDIRMVIIMEQAHALRKSTSMRPDSAIGRTGMSCADERRYS